MLPVLQNGDKVDLTPLERSDAAVGDIIVFANDRGKRIIHRVVGTAPLRTRGDNCAVDDPPPPADVPLYRAVGFARGGAYRKLRGGVSGRREFCRNQRRRALRICCRRLLGPVLMLNPWKTPFEQTTAAVFRDRTVYYRGKRPIGWRDGNGWHWMRFGRFLVQPPPEENDDV